VDLGLIYSYLEAHSHCKRRRPKDNLEQSVAPAVDTLSTYPQSRNREVDNTTAAAAQTDPYTASSSSPEVAGHQHGQLEQREQDLCPGQVRRHVQVTVQCAALLTAQGDPGHEEPAR
jgi:hypothetical protein